MTVINRMPQLFDVDGEHSSVILGFWPSLATAERIAQVDGVQEKAEDLHVTLAFCGKAPDMTDADIARVIDAADLLAREFSEFVVTLSGLGRFDKDDASVIWAAMQNDQLQAMNARAKELLADRGITVDAKYKDGYTPHMTLAYIEPNAESPVTDFPDTPVLFDRLTIAVAGRMAHLPLQTEKSRMTILERIKALITRTPQPEPVKRDLMMHMVWENVYAHFDRMNREAVETDEDGYTLYDPNTTHWFQELYIASGGGMFALSVQGGKLYRSAVAVSDAGVTVGMPEQVVAKFEPLQRTRVIARTNDTNLPIFLSILATAALNKAGELDTRSLFDSFVERFTGDDEYINLYHLDKDKSRIGRLLWIGRDENLLLGLWTPDDNQVGRAVADTIEADNEGEWGVSIEFLPDNDGELIEIAPGVEVRAFTAGELWGASVVRSAHACSWFTGHSKERSFTMNKEVKAAIQTLIQNPDALAEFETWVDGANRTIKDSGAITRGSTGSPTDDAATSDAAGASTSSATGEQAPDLAAQLATLTATVTTLAASVAAMQPATVQATEPTTIELGPEAAEGIAQAVFSGAEFRSLTDGVARLSGALEAQSKQTLDAVAALADRVTKLEADATTRLAKLEATDEDKLRAHDEMKPKGSTVTVSWRAPRGKEEGKPTNDKTLRLADAVLKAESAWTKQ